MGANALLYVRYNSYGVVRERRLGFKGRRLLRDRNFSGALPNSALARIPPVEVVGESTTSQGAANKIRRLFNAIYRGRGGYCEHGKRPRQSIRQNLRPNLQQTLQPFGADREDR